MMDYVIVFVLISALVTILFHDAHSAPTAMQTTAATMDVSDSSFLTSAAISPVDTSVTDAPTEPSTEPSTKPDTAGGYRQVVIIVVAVCCTVMVVTIFLLVVCWLYSVRLYKRYSTPREDLLRLVKEEEFVINSDTLKDKCKDVLKMSEETDRQKITDLLDKVANKEKEMRAKAEGKTITVVGARDEGTLPLLKENCVQLAGQTQPTLHMSKLADLYNNPIYLTAAPMPPQFADQWKAIWQEKVGVIVWIGRFETPDGKYRMDRYIGEKEGEVVRHGDFVVTTITGASRFGRFNVNALEVQYGSVKRRLVLIHAFEWLESTISWALRRDVHTILTVKQEHCRQIPNGLPGLMIQCRLGTAGSATMSAVYIGYQTYLRCRKVNLIGIISYIRSQRFGAFEMTGDPHHTFLLQVQIVYTVMTGMMRFGSTGNIPLFEPWIREIWGT